MIMETEIHKKSVLIMWSTRMGVQEKIDFLWKPPGNWGGLSYGQSAQLFLAYVIHALNHRPPCVSVVVAYRARKSLAGAHRPVHERVDQTNFPKPSLFCAFGNPALFHAMISLSVGSGDHRMCRIR